MAISYWLTLATKNIFQTLYLLKRISKLRKFYIVSTSSLFFLLSFSKKWWKKLAEKVLLIFIIAFFDQKRRYLITRDLIREIFCFLDRNFLLFLYLCKYFIEFIWTSFKKGLFTIEDKYFWGYYVRIASSNSLLFPNDKIVFATRIRFIFVQS